MGESRENRKRFSHQEKGKTGSNLQPETAVIHSEHERPSKKSGGTQRAGSADLFSKSKVKTTCLTEADAAHHSHHKISRE